MGINIKKMFYGDGVTPLPNNVIIPAFFLLIFGYMNMTMPFSFMPQLFKSFGDSEIVTGYHIAIFGSVLFLGRIFGCLFWGEMADRFGKKKIVLICGTCLLLSTLAFGFTKNSEWAVTTRFLQGLSLGLFLSSKSLVMQHTDETNSSFAVSILIATFFFAMIVGSVVGGYLSFPHEKYPNAFGKDTLFDYFNILLPNLFIVIGCLISLISFGIFVEPLRKKTPKDEGEITEQLIEKNENEDVKSAVKEIKIFQVLRTKHYIMVALLFFCFNFASFPIEEVYPLYAATAKNYHGFGFSTSQIATSLLVAAFLSLFTQIFISPRVINRLGPRKTFIYSCLFQVCLYPIIPLLQGLQENQGGFFWFFLLLITWLLRVNIMTCHVVLFVMVENCVHPSLSGSANGVALVCSTIGRVVGIYAFASIYGWSLTNVNGVASNEEALGFPLDQYFVFFLLGFATLLNGVYGSFLPSVLERKSC